MLIELNKNMNNFRLSKEDIKAIVSFNIGRTDFFWEYTNGVPFCVKHEFKAEDMNNHLIGAKVFGFSPFVDNKNVMFGAVDFDAHRDEDDTEEDYQKKVIAAQGDSKKVYEFMKSFKLPVILNSSGSEGRHVRWYCGSAPAANVRMYLKFVLYKLLGDPNKHEVFPKQDELCNERPYGNQIKGCLCVHPKHKKRANVIAGNKILDLHNSIKVMKLALENSGNIPRFSKKEYETINVLDKSHAYVEKYNTPEYKGLIQDVPERCAFFEDVAAKYPLPSKDKYSRHGCLDSNMAAYGITHPEIKIAYANTQGRTSHTAFDNWSKYWVDGKAEFKCPQIIAYLRNHSKFGNKNAMKGLKKCLSCPKFKEFMKKNYKPVGRCRVLNILNVAEKEGIKECPICNKEFIFDKEHGTFRCETCGMFGGVRKLLQLSIKQTGRYI